MVALQENVMTFDDGLSVRFDDRGHGPVFLVLHGGAGPASVGGLAAALAQGGRTIVPIHPGFAGQPRPEGFHRIDDLATTYLALLERLDVTDVVVVGNSVGGWIAAEMALKRSSRIAAIVLVNAVGIDPPPGNPGIANPATLAPERRAALAFHDPAKFIFPQTPEALAAMAANHAALMAYAGDPYMHDPRLRDRLADLRTPTLVLWGSSDGIVDVEYGRRFADSIPGARFEEVAEAGHFPHIEKLDAVVEAIDAFRAGER